MAKAKAADGTKKKKKPASAKTATRKVKSAKRGKKAGGDHKGFEKLGKLADHPLIGDLLAVGAMAAVAAIAEKGFSGSSKGKTGGSAQAVKAAGRAAAAAIGKRLLTEVGEIRKAAKPS
ncbi:MAG: hypothetical protein H0W65_01750 [Sphingomonas sp.]|uniref:hypothetical protein n=1 Tax=Sphingomonas sp. TaxID=28214 RepID=UPI00182A7E8A|nr:hypothetical protein [Sphingomonas sp.]MBA3666433.1 hypothetical protein [Sphingomonas sp.]